MGRGKHLLDQVKMRGTGESIRGREGEIDTSSFAGVGGGRGVHGLGLPAEP